MQAPAIVGVIGDEADMPNKIADLEVVMLGKLARQKIIYLLASSIVIIL